MFGSGLPRGTRPLAAGLGLICVAAVGLDAARYGLPLAMGLFLFQTLPAIVGSLLLSAWIISQFFPEQLLSSGSREHRREALITVVAVCAGSAIVVGGLFGGPA